MELYFPLLPLGDLIPYRIYSSIFPFGGKKYMYFLLGGISGHIL